MKKLIAILLFVSSVTLAQTKVITKEKPLTIKSIVKTTWYDSTLTTYTEESSNVGSSVGGAVVGYLLFGKHGLSPGAIVGSSASKTYTTHHRWDKTLVYGYKVTVSDGYTFNTKDNSYKIGQQIKYK